MNGHYNNSLIEHANSSALTAPDLANRAAANLLALMHAAVRRRTGTGTCRP
jgi:hypothetical protein